MILQKVTPRKATGKEYTDIEQDTPGQYITRKVIFTEEELKKHPSIKNIVTGYSAGHEIYLIHSFNDVEMNMQSIAHFSKEGKYWYWQSFNFGTPIHKGVNTLLNDEFKDFLVRAKITEKEFREFIIDLEEMNQLFIQELQST